MVEYLLYAFIAILGACNSNHKKGGDYPEVTQIIDSKSELEKWIKELLGKRVVGTPCGNPLIAANRLRFAENNFDEVMNGLPSNEKDYHIVNSDFNNDKKNDLLMFFESTNCTGHNGHISQNFARIVYNDGSMVDDLAKKIYEGILNEFNKIRKNDKYLMEVDDSYQESDTNIEKFSNGELSGIFSLYELKDAHCCPSYSGRYIYHIATQTTTLDFKKNFITNYK